jgi:hypothetical protein
MTTGREPTRGNPDLYLVVDTPNGSFVRTIAPAIPLVDDSSQGVAEEEATRSAVAKWGLPDFVFHPLVRQVGSGVREVGDVVLLHGDYGLVVQVKSRLRPGDAPERERSWLLKANRKARRQAAGTVRTLRTAPTTLRNLRGREIEIVGAQLKWLAAVVIDHANPPPDFVPTVPPTGLPSLTLLRRDWEFLFDQLRSTHAVVQYLHRAGALDPVPIGQEPVRYYELAQADEDAPAQDLGADILGEAEGGRHFPCRFSLRCRLAETTLGHICSCG